MPLNRAKPPPYKQNAPETVHGFGSIFYITFGAICNTVLYINLYNTFFFFVVYGVISAAFVSVEIEYKSIPLLSTIRRFRVYIQGATIQNEEWNYDKTLSDHKGIGVCLDFKKTAYSIEWAVIVMR